MKFSFIEKGKLIGSDVNRWIKSKYQKMMEAIHNGERIHRLIQERKNEELLKATKHGFPINFL